MMSGTTPYGSSADHVDQPSAEQRAVVRPGGRGQREQGVAVVGGLQGDHRLFVTPAELDPVLTRELECGLHRLGSASQRVDELQLPGGHTGELGGELLDRIVREGRPVHIAEPARLLPDRGRDLGDPVADADGERTPAPIEVPAAGIVEDVTSLSPDDARVPAHELPVQNIRSSGGGIRHPVGSLHGEEVGDPGASRGQNVPASSDRRQGQGLRRRGGGAG